MQMTNLKRLLICDILIALRKRNNIEKIGTSTYKLLASPIAQPEQTPINPICEQLENATQNETYSSKVKKVLVRKTFDIDHLDDDFFFNH